MIFSSSDPRLKYLYALCMGLGLIWVNYSHFQSLPGLTLLLSNAVVFLGAAPLYFWLQDEQREAIPLMPMTGFFYAVTFGFAGFSRFQESQWDPWHFQIQEDTFDFALACVIAGLLSLYLAYYVLGPKLAPKEGKMPSFPFYVKSAKAYTVLAYLGFPIICLLYWLSRQGVMGELTLSFQIVSQFIFYLLMAAYLQGLLSTSEKVALFLIFVYQFFIGSGFLEGSIGPLIVNLIAICILSFAIKRKVPWGWIVAIALTIFLIQPIKGELRNQIWQLKSDGTAAELKQGTTVVDSMGELSKILGARYLSKQGAEKLEGESTDDLNYEPNDNRLNGRLNLLYPLAWLLMNTPDPQPYRYGETYTPLLTKWIPRILWQNKPRETLGNEWVRTYGLASADDFAYSYNLPWVAEMYMNFGFSGVLGVSFFLGLLFYVLKLMVCQVPNEPSKLAFGVVLATPLMLPESHLSLVLGGVIVQAILLLLLCYVASKLLPNWFKASETMSNSRIGN